MKRSAAKQLSLFEAARRKNKGGAANEDREDKRFVILPDGELLIDWEPDVKEMAMRSKP